MKAIKVLAASAIVAAVVLAAILPGTASADAPRDAAPRAGFPMNVDVSTDGEGNLVALVAPEEELNILQYYGLPSQYAFRFVFDPLLQKWSCEQLPLDQVVQPSVPITFRKRLYSYATYTWDRSTKSIMIPTLAGTAVTAQSDLLLSVLTSYTQDRRTALVGDATFTVQELNSTTVWTVRATWKSSVDITKPILAVSSAQSAALLPSANLPSNPAMEHAQADAAGDSNHSTEEADVRHNASLLSQLGTSGLGPAEIASHLKLDTAWRLSEVWSGPQSILPKERARTDLVNMSHDVTLFQACFPFEAGFVDCEACGSAHAGYYVNVSYDQMRVCGGYWVPVSIQGNCWAAMTFKASLKCGVLLGIAKARAGVTLRAGAHLDFFSGLQADNVTLAAWVDTYAKITFKLKVEVVLFWVIKKTLFKTGYERTVWKHRKSWSHPLGAPVETGSGPDEYTFETPTFTANTCVPGSECAWGNHEPFDLYGCGRTQVKLPLLDHPVEGADSLVVQNAYGASRALFGKTRNACADMHYGIDLHAEPGTPIRAAQGGQVVIARNLSGYGNVVYINHTDALGQRWQTRYAHLSEIFVSESTSIGRGTVIGAAGNTGNAGSTANGLLQRHLHFEVRQGHGTTSDTQGLALDPVPWLGW